MRTAREVKLEESLQRLRDHCEREGWKDYVLDADGALKSNGTVPGPKPMKAADLAEILLTNPDARVEFEIPTDNQLRPGYRCGVISVTHATYNGYLSHPNIKWIVLKGE